jgi:hypothetical protein
MPDSSITLFVCQQWSDPRLAGLRHRRPNVPLTPRRSSSALVGVVAWTAINLLGCLLNASAEASEQRVALMLSGSSCEENRKTLQQYFKTVHGVKAADLGSVPGFALVDIEAGTTTPDELTAAFNHASAISSQCQAQIMESCISMPQHGVASHTMGPLH